MRVRQLMLCVLACTVLVATTSVANGQPGETFTATATVKTAGGASATAPVTISVDRAMPQSEADGLVAAFKSGGVSGLRKALKGVAPTGSVTLGSGMPGRRRRGHLEALAASAQRIQGLGQPWGVTRPGASRGRDERRGAIGEACKARSGARSRRWELIPTPA